MSVTLIAISDISVGDRTRQNMGPISDLKESIGNIGLINPITVDSDFNLLAGARRLACCKELGWNTIPAHIIGSDEVTGLQVELDENVCRQEFSPSEKLALATRLNEAMKIKNVSYKDRTKVIAEQTGLGRTDIAAVAKVVKDGDEELVKSMDSGEITIREAAEIAKEPKEKQRKLVREKKEKSAPEQPEKEPTDNPIDGIGLEVREEVLQAFDVIPLINKAVALLKAIYPLIDEIASHTGGERYRAYACLRKSRKEKDAAYVSKSLANTVYELNRLAPYSSVCPKCYANPDKGCRICYGLGWVTLETWSSADTPQALKDALLARIQKQSSEE